MIAEYYWKGTNRFGQTQQGKCLAKNREQLEQQLHQQGYSHIKIRYNIVLPKAPKTEDITQILNQISLLLNAKIPLNQALSMILQNCTQIKLYQWLNDLIQQLQRGFSFSIAIEQSKKYLSPQEIQLIKMGETSGQLPTILSKLVTTRHKAESLQKKIKKILFYPVIVLFISVALSLMLLIFIVPQFAELYGTKQKTLPLITDILFRLSTFLTENIPLICAVFFSLIILFLTFKKTLFLNRLKQKIFSHLPIFKHIINHARIIYFCQNSALMLQSHLRIDAILNAFLHAQQSDIRLHKEVQFMLKLLQQGYRLHEGLNPAVFGNDVIQMVAIGERSGNLAEMLNHISEIYQQRLDYQIDLLSQLLEPMLMVIMGAIVGTIIVGLYLPIFDMGTLVE